VRWTFVELIVSYYFFEFAWQNYGNAFQFTEAIIQNIDSLTGHGESVDFHGHTSGLRSE